MKPTPCQLLDRFGPRKPREKVGVPADHFDTAERPNHRKTLKQVRRELARREAR